MIVIPPRDPRFRPRYEDLPTACRFHKLSEGPPAILVGLQRVGEVVFSKEGIVRGQQRLPKWITQIRNHARMAHVSQQTDLMYQITKGDFTGWRNASPMGSPLRPLSFAEERVYHIVDVHQLEQFVRIRNRYRNPVGNIVTECGNGGIVVRPAPFPEHVRKTIDDSGPAGFTVFNKG